MGRIATSPDGATWTTRANPQDPKPTGSVGFSPSGYSRVVFGDGIFVALSSFNSFPSEATKFVISEDNGVTWQALPANNLVTQGLNGLSGFVAGLPGVAGSFNGIRWMPELSCWYGWGSASITGMFTNICLSTVSCIVSSTDLVNWSPVASPFDILHSGSNAPFVEEVSSDGAGNFRACGGAGYEGGGGADFGYVCDACHSTDGVTWLSYGNHTPGFNGPWANQTPVGVFWDGTNWVYLMSGTVGPMWIVNSELTTPFNALGNVGVGIRAAYNGAGVAVVPVGATSLPLDLFGNGVSPQVSLLAGNSGGGYTNPTNPWNYPYTGGRTTFPKSIAYGSGLFVAIAISEATSTEGFTPVPPCSVATSPDGFAWTNQGFITAMNTVASRYVNTGGDPWSAQPADIAFGNGVFVVVGNGTIPPTSFSRQHPRDDRKGLGAPRNPMSAVGSASVQSSNRQGYRGTYT